MHGNRGALVVAGVCAALGMGSVAMAAPRTRTVEVRDDAWGIVAFRMEIPADWSFEGELLRDPYCGGVPQVVYRMASPDGLSGYQSLPAFLWHQADDPQNVAIYRRAHCKIMDPMSAADFLAYLAPVIRPSPTIGPIGPTVDAAQLDAMARSYNDRLAAARMGGRELASGARSLLEYTFHGRPVEENLRVVVTTFEVPLPNARGGWVRSSNTTAEVSGIRAPKGHLAAVADELRPMIQVADYTAEWKQRQARQSRDDQARAMEGIRRRGAETAAMLQKSHDAYIAASKQRFAKGQQLERERQAAVHNGAVAWTLYAGDEQLVRDPAGHVSRMTNQGGTHVHQDQISGDVVATTDPNFDPSYYLRGQWTQLEVVDPTRP